MQRQTAAYHLDRRKILDMIGLRWTPSNPRTPAMPAARTPAQIEASRRNGARSRGPVTEEGKARASRNALKLMHLIGIDVE